MNFHLSVNAEGVVSLWDSEQQARDAEIVIAGYPSEVYVEMTLTEEQRLLILAAQLAAIEKNRLPSV